MGLSRIAIGWLGGVRENRIGLGSRHCAMSVMARSPRRPGGPGVGRTTFFFLGF